MPDLIRSAGLPGTKAIPAVSHLLSFLAMKLIGAERYDHRADQAFDPGLGLFADLNFFARDVSSKPVLYTAAEVIKEAHEQVMAVLSV